LTRGLANSLAEGVGLTVMVGELGNGFDFVGSDISAGLFLCWGGSLGPIKGEALVGDVEGRVAPEGKEGPIIRGLLVLPGGREGPISLLLDTGCFVISNEGVAFFTLVASTASRAGLVIS